MSVGGIPVLGEAGVVTGGAGAAIVWAALRHLNDEYSARTRIRVGGAAVVRMVGSEIDVSRRHGCVGRVRSGMAYEVNRSV